MDQSSNKGAKRPAYKGASRPAYKRSGPSPNFNWFPLAFARAKW